MFIDGVLQEHYASHPPKSEDVVDLFAFEVITGGKMNEKTAKLHGMFLFYQVLIPFKPQSVKRLIQYDFYIKKPITFLRFIFSEHYIPVHVYVSRYFLHMFRDIFFIF